MMEPASTHEQHKHFDEMFVAMTVELRKVASAMRRQRRTETVSTTDIVNETYLKLRGSAAAVYRDELHFRRTAALAMRQYLTDRARRKTSDKRGGGARMVTLSQSVAAPPFAMERYLDLERALERLAKEDPLQADIVNLRFYAGCTSEEVGSYLNLSVATVDRRIKAASAWLKLVLSGKIAMDDIP